MINIIEAIVAQHVRQPTTCDTGIVYVTGLCSNCATLISLTDSVPGKTVGDGPVWASAIHVGGPDRVLTPGFGLAYSQLLWLFG